MPHLDKNQLDFIDKSCKVNVDYYNSEITITIKVNQWLLADLNKLQDANYPLIGLANMIDYILSKKNIK